MTATTAPTTPAGVLTAAADWLEEDPTRWGRDYFVNPENGCRCALGTIAHVVDPHNADDDPWFISQLSQDAVRALADYLVDQPNVRDLRHLHPDLGERNAHVQIVGGWNDDERHTVTDVIAALRGAAERAR